MKRTQALEGIKVVDFGTVFVGPQHAKLLADHGATVVRVESHTVIEVQRITRPYKDGVPGVNRSGTYDCSNSSKYGISIDLRKPKGLQIGMKLLEWADVACSGMAPGSMKRLGLDYDVAKKVNPGIIYLSTSQLGEYGPYASFAGFGPHAGSFAGLYHVSGRPDRGPGGHCGAAYTDIISPRFGVASIIAALDYRRRTGRGQHLDLSQSEASMHFIAPLIMDCAVTGRVANRSGNHLPQAAPHDVYRCQGEDRWVAVAVFTDEQWRAFCRVIGEPEWTKSARFATFEARKQHEDEMDKLITSWSTTQNAERVMAMMQEARVAAGLVQSVKDLYADPQFEHRGHFRWLDHPVMGVHAYHGPPYRLSKTPDRQFAAPTLGQHNEYVLRELLHMTDEQIAELLIERVITTEADMPDFRSSV